MGYFFMERWGWVNIKTSQVSIIAQHMDEIKYIVIIKNSFTISEPAV